MNILSKKTKLTLTVKKSVVISAKRYSRQAGKSVSALFEEMFQHEKFAGVKSEQQRAAERLLMQLENAKEVKTKNDKQLLKSHVARKFA